jgi:predicted NBD/HSP70 family sugar kinase
MLNCGIDLGGSKVELIVLDRAGWSLMRRRLPTPQGDCRAALDVIARLVAAAEKEPGVELSVGVGVGAPGALSKAFTRIAWPARWPMSSIFSIPT